MKSHRFLNSTGVDELVAFLREKHRSDAWTAASIASWVDAVEMKMFNEGQATINIPASISRSGHDESMTISDAGISVSHPVIDVAARVI
ncbi:MAG: hypothetical protein WBC18_12075 [Ottowia sp.]|uniref:hypothetical protein n=1 Tax=Ottowia sp. TaxID=1898956 RepID=UPI003C7524D2